ncbi:MAG: polysaccharide deacetylase family protein [Saprospiraceae bacterium]
MIRLTTSPAFQAEKTYACSVLFGELLGVPWEIQFDPDEQHYRIHLPNGATLTVEDHFLEKQPQGTYLTAANVPESAFRMAHPFEPEADVIGVYGRPFFEQNDRQVVCGIDLFASAFFMLTRWEEYVRPERDAFGRFPAAAALAVRAGFLERPVVHEYADLLAQMLTRLGYAVVPSRAGNGKLHLSCDVDHPRLWWSAADRLRTLGGSIFRRKNLHETAWWLQNHIFNRRDPYDIFETWMDVADERGAVFHFNFLGNRPNTADCPYPLRHPFVLALIRRITERGHVVGFHPSREAHADSVVFDRELASLREVCPMPVNTGRQHYLCFSAPETWQRWADAGMQWDSTLGYPEAEGFRCGMCRDYPLFNFLTQKQLLLREKPLIAMDTTLAMYRGYTPEQAIDRLLRLRQTVDKYGGEFVLLWHNSSVNTFFWKNWDVVFGRCISPTHPGSLMGITTFFLATHFAL